MLTRILVFTLTAASTVAIGPTAAAVADDPHPARIQAGACTGGGVTVAELADVSGSYLVDGTPSAGPSPVGLESAVPLAASVTTIPVALADLVAADHSLLVERSAIDPTIVACADIGGRTLGDLDLPIGLGVLDGSGLSGVASFHDAGDGTTKVTVYLVGDEGGMAAAPGAGPASATATPGSSLYYAGLDITVEGVTYDEDAATLTVNATFHNTATAPVDLNLLSGGQASIWWDQTVLDLSPANAPVPAGATVRGTLMGTSIPAGFVMDDAVLTFGRPGDHQATLPLAAGSVATFDPPLQFDVAKTVRAKKYATFEITSAQVVPARCSGNSDEFVLEAAPSNEATILLTATVTGGRDIGVGGMSLAGAFATDPSGVSGASDLLVPVLGVRDVVRDMHYCFPVAAPVQGAYKITFLTDPAKAAVSIDVP